MCYCHARDVRLNLDFETIARIHTSFWCVLLSMPGYFATFFFFFFFCCCCCCCCSTGCPLVIAVASVRLRTDNSGITDCSSRVSASGCVFDALSCAALVAAPMSARDIISGVDISMIMFLSCDFPGIKCDKICVEICIILNTYLV